MFKHKRVFTASFVTVMLAVVIYSATHAQKYFAGITIVLASHSTHNPLNPSDASISDSARIESVMTQFQALVSTKQFIEDALTDSSQKPIALNSPIDVNNSKQLAELQKDVSISSDAPNSFYIQVEYGNPSDTNALLYGLTSAYLSRYEQEETAYYSSQVDFLANEVDSYRKKLADSENKLANWKKLHAPGSMDVMENNESALSDLQDRRNDAQIQVSDAQQRLDAMMAQSLSVPKLIQSGSDAADAANQAKLGALKDELSTDINQKNMTPDHPAVIALNKQIQLLEKSMNPSPSSAAYKKNPAYFVEQTRILNAKLDLEDQKAALAAIDKRIAAVGMSLKKEPGYENDLSDLSRDVVNLSQSYNSLTANLEQAKMNLTISKRNADDEFQMYQTVLPTKMRSLKHMAMLYLGGLFVGLALGAFMVFLAEWMDRSIHDVYAASLALAAPILGATPEFSPRIANKELIVDSIVSGGDTNRAS